jgi:hypothetical protein
LDEDMEKVQGWCTSNDMVINTMKSKSKIMGSSRKIQYLEHKGVNHFYTKEKARVQVCFLVIFLI